MPSVTCGYFHGCFCKTSLYPAVASAWKCKAPAWLPVGVKPVCTIFKCRKVSSEVSVLKYNTLRIYKHAQGLQKEQLQPLPCRIQPWWLVQNLCNQNFGTFYLLVEIKYIGEYDKILKHSPCPSKKKKKNYN